MNRRFLIETFTRLTKDLTVTHGTIRVKVGHFATGRTKHERFAYGGVEAGELIVLNLQRRNEMKFIKAIARHGTRELIVVDV